MSTSTELRQIALVGPPLAGVAGGDDRFTWTATVATAFQGENREDKSLVGSTFGLRVLLQDVATQEVRIKLHKNRQGSEAVNTTVRLHTPRLLVAHLRARQIKSERDKEACWFWRLLTWLLFPFFGKERRSKLVASTLSFPNGEPYRLRAPEPDPGEETLGFFTVAVTPVDPWPTPQYSRFIEVPRLTLAEHRMRVLVNITRSSKTNPLGFLRFAKLNDSTAAAFVAKPSGSGIDVLSLPHLELPLISLLTTARAQEKEDFVALDLTPDGIELRATITNPMLGFDPAATPPRLSVVLRLVHQTDPVSPEQTLWTLQLVREEGTIRTEAQGHQIRDALKRLRNGFVPDQDKPLFLDIDTQAAIPAVRWPLRRNDDGSLSFPSQQVGERWRLWVDAKALDVSLTGAPLRGSELPTVVKVAADRLQVVAAGAVVIATLEADRRDPALRKQAPGAIPGPHLVLDWARQADRRQLSLSNDNNGLVPWFFDPDALARELVQRYTRRGVQPPRAAETHAFLPIEDGWLQLPLALPSKAGSEALTTVAPTGLDKPHDAVPLSGPFETRIPVVGSTGPSGRRLTVLATDRVVAEAKFAQGELDTIQLKLEGAAGTADGVLWFAAGSPTPEEVLPSLAAGPASLIGPPLQFRRPTARTEGLSRIDSTTFSSGKSLVLSFPTLPAKDPGATAYAWLAYSELPLVTAVPLTRTAAGSGLPSQTRGLLCREIDRKDLKITLTHTPDGEAPVLGLSQGASRPSPHLCPLAKPSAQIKPSPQEKITLVAVTTTGIELKPAPALFADLRVRLSYQPPLLIDYFASVRLPQTALVAEATPTLAEQPPVDTPTSLDMPALFEAWQSTLDRMALARVKEADAFGFAPQTASTVQVQHLFGRSTWSTRFSLDTQTAIGNRKLAMGSYRLGDSNYAGEQALQGLTMAFELDSSALKPADAAAKHPLAIVGFAAGAWRVPDSDMWRDSRAALSAELPQVAALGDQLRGLVYREVGVIGEFETVRGWRATLAQPVPIQSPPGNAGRKLSLWFRDLFLEEDGSDKRRFKPDSHDLERAIGPLESAFDAERLPKAMHEWRFCNDTDGQPAAPSLYDIAIEPFRFRPLRLYGLALKLGAGGGVSEAIVLGSLSPPGDQLTSKEPGGPFGPDPDYRTGNLLAVTLKRNGQGELSFNGATWEKAQVTDSVELGGTRELVFRLAEVPVSLGGLAKPELGQTTLRLVLPFEDTASENSLPTFGRASMETILFGRRVKYEGGTVNVTGEQIEVSFLPAPTLALPTSGVALSRVQLHWSSAGTLLKLEGELQLHACEEDAPKSEPRQVLWQQLGGPLCWLNLQVPTNHCKFKVDHQRGTLAVEVDWDGLDKAPAQPIAGLSAAKADIRASLTMACSDLEKGPSTDYVFPSIAGFGALSLLSSTGPTLRLDHVLLAEWTEAPTPWSSRIEIDLKLAAHPSRIHWPVGSLPDRVGPPSKTADLDLGTLASKVSGCALQGQLSPYADTGTLRHCVTLNVIGQRLPTTLLQVSGSGQDRHVALGAAWTFIALAEHSLAYSGKTEALSWTTLDHVAAVDARQLLIAAQDALLTPSPLVSKADFAFAPRLKRTDQQDDAKPALKGGLLLRAFAQAGFPVQALAQHLVAGMFDSQGKLNGQAVSDGIVVTGAGATSVEIQGRREGPFWPAADGEVPSDERHGLLLSLPWLTAVQQDFDFGVPGQPQKLAEFRQAHPTATRQWDAPDIDWAAGSPMPLARAIAPAVSPGSGSAPDLVAMLRQLTPSHLDVPNLQPVEQLFLRPVGAGKLDPITQRPLWLRSLLALRAWCRASNKERQTLVTMLVPLEVGRVVRFRLAPRSPRAGAERLGRSGQLIAIERTLTRFEDVPLIEANGGFQQAKHRARLVARAERLVKEPIAVVTVAQERQSGTQAGVLWTSVQVPADLDDTALDIPMALDAKDRLYASAALGWPTAQGAAQAASGALGLGDDFPFQDLPVASEANAADVKSFGSGLSGRVTSLSMPARADNSQGASDSTAATFIDTQSPVYLALGRKVIFDRPTNLPVVSPPARHLSPTEARAVVPVAGDLQATLARVVQGHAAPLVPPMLERASLGMRPGAMAAEFDMLLFTAGPAGPNENFDTQFERFGRPGHAGPRLLRQHRAPRAPALPRVPRPFVKSHGRRTYVEVDEFDYVKVDESESVDGQEIARPFLLMAGTGTVLRNAGRSYRIRVLDMPLRPDWPGALSLHVSSASCSSDVNALAMDLAGLGVLHTEARASLTINGHVLSFTLAWWRAVATPPCIGLVLTLKGVDLAGMRARLDAVDGDSRVFLSFQCGRQDNNNNSLPTENADFAIAPPPPAKSTGPAPPTSPLTQETRRFFSLPVPVQPDSRPILPVSTATLVFADPSYDRALAGPGATDTFRDGEGKLWKLTLDRQEYGTDTPLYLALGPIDGATGRFSEQPSPAPMITLTFRRQPASIDGQKPVQAEDLELVDLRGPKYSINVSQAYGISFDRFRPFEKADAKPLVFLPGDQLVVTATLEFAGSAEVTLIVRAKLVSRPIIAPPPAVYALVVPDGEKAARVVLHATAPLPQVIEFPSLLEDLAVGHIRRAALFVWPTQALSATVPQEALLVKVDRAGGGQVPEYLTDLQRVLQLPSLS